MLLLPILLALSQRPPAPESLWMEAEWFGPLKGSNFSFMTTDRQTRGSWAVAGPDAAPAWTQGGESEWMSVAARADEPGEIAISRDVEIPADSSYTLWVRFADYRAKNEEFGVRIRQGERAADHVFGRGAVVDELDPMKLLWGWVFAWDHAEYALRKGPAHVEIHTTGPTEARRAVDCLCLTTDSTYRPHGREKPDAPVWRLMRGFSTAPSTAPLPSARDVPKAWRIASGPPTFLWNVGPQWLDGLKQPPADRIDAPFGVDPPLLKPFTEMYRGKSPQVYSSPLSAPIPHIPLYPVLFQAGSVFGQWMDAHPNASFGILLNYGDPAWLAGTTPADRAAAHANLKRYGQRFMGYIAGESIAYDNIDNAELERRVRAAKGRGEILAALRELHSAAARAKFADYYGGPVSDTDAWSPVISCLSASNESFCHALCAWGVRRIGHENTGNSPTLARRLAFLRGAARQFGAKMVDYQSCNLGDSATMYSRENYFYPGSSRYVMDNQYDVWAGAGVNWLLKDYVLWHMAGVDAFYNEQGIDLFWKPGGGVAGDEFPVQLSPKGQIAEAAIRLAERHLRGTQVTPIAFLLDEAHGWSQENFQPGAFGLDPAWNPALLQPGRHEAAIRGWFDVAYFPAPQTQYEPATAIRQTYVNGIFGDIFDVLVTAPKHTQILSTYPVVIAAGEIRLTDEWGIALREYVRAGGTLVVCADQLSGPGAAVLGMPKTSESREADQFRWLPGSESMQSSRFRYYGLAPWGAQPTVLAPDGTPIVLERRFGAGRLIFVGIPLGLGIDRRPNPVLALLMRRVAVEVTPVRVTGDVEWALNRADDGAWIVTLLNNRGIFKPEHGMLPTDQSEEQRVTVQVPFAGGSASEWMTMRDAPLVSAPSGASLSLKVPAGAVRIVSIRPASKAP